MLKRLIMILLSIGVVAMFWHATPAHAACAWVQGSNGWCYNCSCAPYTLAGKYIQPSQCIHFIPGSVTELIGLKFMPQDAHKCTDTDCPTVVTALFGTVDADGQPCEFRGDTSTAGLCSMLMDIFCCPPGHIDPLTGECTDPVWSEGWPGLHPGYLVGADGVTDCTKRNCLANIDFLTEQGFCPNTNWFEEVLLKEFDAVTCTCPLGFRQTTTVGPEWKCCYEENKQGDCISFEPVGQTIDLAAAVSALNCNYNEGEYDCDTTPMVVQDQFCNQLYTEYINQMNQ